MAAASDDAPGHPPAADRTRGRRYLPVGPRALLVEVVDAGAVAALAAEVDRRRRHGWRPGIVDVVPGATTVLVDGTDDPAGLAVELDSWEVPAVSAGPATTVDIPCTYDGPDLADVAARWGMSPEAAGRHHAGLAHRVAFCGFAPGFAYIAGLGDRWAVPRRPTARISVPAGSVAVAGPYTGIYPRASPGGWQLIGRTDARLWDLDREPAALLVPGAVVRFVVP